MFNDLNVRTDDGSRQDDAADDRSTRARIRDAAVACFSEMGVTSTTVRQIAERAGVSAGLVIHHFGSKERLRVACDSFVAAYIRTRKSAAMRAGPGIDPLAALRAEAGGPPIQRYLARTLAEGTPQVAALVDEMVADAERYLAEAAEQGVMRPTDHPRGVAAVLVLWSLGALVLHEHVERLLGVDITGPADAHATNTGYVAPALEVLSHGLLEPTWYERLAGSKPAGQDDAQEGEP